MCVIIHKPNERSVPAWVLRKCFDANPHGAGYMYASGGEVYGRKGFMSVDELLRSLKDCGLATREGLVKAGELVLHFRRATHGGRSSGNTHPFPASRKVKDLTALRWRGSVGVAHNGVIAGTGAGASTSLSDSQEFIRQVLSGPGLLASLRAGDKGVRELLDLATRGSRLLILWGDGHSLRTGDWTVASGITFSNTNWRPDDRRLVWTKAA